MAQRARDAEPRDGVGGVDAGLHADDGVQREQGDRGRRVVQVDLPRLELRHQCGGERVHVHLEPDAECGLGADALDHLVHLERIGPERLVAEGVEPEDVLPVEQRALDRGVRRGFGASHERDQHGGQEPALPHTHLFAWREISITNV